MGPLAAVDSVFHQVFHAAWPGFTARVLVVFPVPIYRDGCGCCHGYRNVRPGKGNHEPVLGHHADNGMVIDHVHSQHNRSRAAFAR